MKTKIIFDLPEDQEQYELHMSAGKLHSACWDFAEWLRGVCKHDDPKKYDAEACREKFYQFLQENDYVL